MRTLVASLLLLAVLPGCRADEEIRRGAEGEFCNGRDEDCREGLVCQFGACAATGPGPVYDCSDVCTRLTECDATERGCASDCRLTTDGWALRARNAFGVCVVEDLTCDEARETFAPQLCYSRIPVPAERRARCDAFVDFARECGAANDALERVLEGCVAVARVSKQARWESAAACEEATGAGNCDEAATCFNTEFELDRPVALD